MKAVILLLCCFVVAQANVLKSEHEKEFEKWVAKYGKSYNNDVEREFRFKIFVDTRIRVTRHNEEYKAGLQTFKMGMNKYSDKLESEVFNGVNKVEIPKKNSVATLNTMEERTVSDSFDWRDHGAVTPVNDGVCDWSNAFTGALEGALFIKSGSLVKLSEWNLVDCEGSYEQSGCGGGSINKAYDVVFDERGIDTEESYPKSKGRCGYRPGDSVLVLNSYVDLPTGDEEALKQAVVITSPIAVTINANSDFQHYSGGVMTSNHCSSSSLNHPVLVVGYGTEEGQDYWLVKNSWGTSWGEDGYIRMRRNYSNMCGIASDASYPVL